MNILSLSVKLILFILLFVITLVHVYWMCGGQRGLNEALPISLSFLKEKYSKKMLLFLQSIMIFPVVLGLIFLMISLFDFISVLNPYSILIYQSSALIFILRSVLGPVINKWSKNEIFTHWNSKLYSPLSFFIGLGFLIISLA